MEIANNHYVFQSDSDIVLSEYRNSDNYLIVHDTPEANQSRVCAIYFSSNDIYYPNTAESFTARIKEKNAFEWLGLKFRGVQKHIFLRDIIKQWYLTGINAQINNPEKLLNFLRNETAGYEVVTIGSSAGGYAAVLYGSLLNARKVLTFNGQFELNSLLSTSTERIDPIIFRAKETELSGYYDLRPFITGNDHIFYFYSATSNWDVSQKRHIEACKSVNKIGFSTAHHGIPFPKCALDKVINLSNQELKALANTGHHPLLFSCKMIGIFNTAAGVCKQLAQAYRKRRKAAPMPFQS